MLSFKKILSLVLSFQLPYVLSLAQADTTFSQNSHDLLVEVQQIDSSLRINQENLDQAQTQLSDLGLRVSKKTIGKRTPHEIFHQAFLEFKAGEYAIAALGFIDFLKTYPTHKLAGSAQYYLAESYFKRAPDKEAQLALEAFLKYFPANKHAAEANSDLATMNLDTVVITQAAPAPAPVAAAESVSESVSFPVSASAKIQTVTPAITDFGACEAFNWTTPVKDVIVNSVTHEGKDSEFQWVRAEAIDHLPTLIRRENDSENSQPSQEPIPLISNNTGKILSALSGASLQPGAGIVFGKIAAGWGVRISGRAERPLFLDNQNQSLSSQEMGSARYFAFLNVEPGAHLLYLVSHDGTEEGAVGVSSLEGVASYMDLTQIQSIRVSGRVFDGSGTEVQTVTGADVRVLGSVSTRTQTDGSGAFSLDHILSVPGYPIYIETDAANGYTHRYQVDQRETQDLALYRLGEKVIQSWMGQLEGSISPESGIVIAAAPNMVSERGDEAKLLATVSSLAANPVLNPEVYTVAADGSLKVSEPLSNQSSRFFSVQVPEGPIEVKVTDGHGHVAWSQIFMASPAVINVIGPL